MSKTAEAPRFEIQQVEPRQSLVYRFSWLPPKGRQVRHADDRSFYMQMHELPLKAMNQEAESTLSSTSVAVA